MRLGDLDALFRAINRIRCPQGASMNDGLAEACQAIMEAPTIDAVEVVRCKDCKFFEYGVYCSESKMEHNHAREDDFCSYGERKDGEG